MMRMMGRAKLRGIYAITNVLTGQVYYGQSKDCENRLRVHERSLKGHYHHNQILQASWNKHGKEAFSFCVVCVSDEDLTTLEKKAISEAYSLDLKVFNLADPEAPTTHYGNHNGLKSCRNRLGKKCTEEQKARMRGNHNALGAKRSPEHIAKMVVGRGQTLKTPAIAQEGP